MTYFSAYKCLCCGRGKNVKDNGVWICYYCDSTNTTSYKCKCTDPRFVKYPKIPAYYNIGKKKYAHLHGQKYYITEKIHGSNFSVIFHGVDNVTFARRNGVLSSTNNDYYDYSLLKKNLEECVKKFATLMKAKHVQIYGELYGGKIQPQIKYCDKHQFRVFDVCVDGKFIPYEQFDIVKQAGFDIIPIIMVGSIKDIQQKYISHDQTVPPFKSNFSEYNEVSEGVVAKCVVDGKLFAFKIKTDIFNEMHRGIVKKFSMNKQPVDINKKNKYVDLNIDGIEDCLMNETRLMGVISKNKQSLNRNEIVRKLIEDAAIDFAEYKNYDIAIVRKIMYGMFSDVKKYVEMMLKNMLN